MTEYYTAARPKERLKDIKLPMLWLLADDDPFIGVDYDRQAFMTNPNLALVTTSCGGHVAARESICGPHIWLIDPVAKFLQQFR